MQTNTDTRTGIHPLASIGGFPEAREWIADPTRPYFVPTIDPTALVNAFVTVDSGCERSTTIGARTFLMAHVHIGHDALIGADCELAPHTTVGGWVEMADGVKVGVGATILPFRRIGEGATIGAGAVVTKHVPAGEVWAGNPARPIGPKNAVPYTDR